MEIDRTHPLSRDLIAAWPFLPPGGNTLYDIGGRGLHGTLTGLNPASAWLGTERGAALAFDGTDGHFVDLSSASSLVDVTKGSFLVLLRFDGGEADGLIRSIFEVGEGSDNQNFIGLRKAGTTNNLLFRYRRAGTNADAIAGTVTSFQWLQIVGTYDTSEVTIYLNGVKKDTASRGPDISVSLDQTALGGQGQGPSSNLGLNAFIGPVALACIFAGRLSDEEVAALYARPFSIYRAADLRRQLPGASLSSRNYYTGGIVSSKRIASRGIAW